MRSAAERRASCQARRLAAWCAVAGVGLLGAACSSPSKGALVVALSTDMQTPKDVDVVSVFVSTNSVPKYDYVGRVTPQGTVNLPATIAIVEPDDPNAQVRIRAIAFEQAQAKVLRDVVTTVPHLRTALLRLPLDFLDVGSVQSGTLPAQFVPDESTVHDGPTDWDPTNPTDVVPTCDFTKGLTMVNGVCAGLTVDSSKLPDYTEPAVFGEAGLQSSGVLASCFDVASCFGGASPVTGLDPASCSFPLPSGADAAKLNVALVTPGTGTCLGTAACYVPLPNEATEGWIVQNGTSVQLAAAICTRLGGGVTLAVAFGSCAAQTLSEPVCEPTSADAAILDGAGPADAAASDAPLQDVAVGAQDSGEDSSDAAMVAETSADAAFDATVVDADTGALDATVDAPTDATVDAPAEACSVGGTVAVCSGSCVDTATDPANCGACGNACAGTCAASHCQVTLFSEDDLPRGVAVDSNYVYWTDIGNNAVLKKAKDGGAVVTVASAQVQNSAPIAIDSANVYYAPLGIQVIASPLDGGAAFQIVPNNGYGVSTFVSDGANLYWARGLGCPNDGGPCASGIYSSTLDGGAPVTLAEGPFSPAAMAVMGNAVYWVSEGTPSVQYADGTVMSVALDGGTATTLASSQVYPNAIAVDGVNVYWTVPGTSFNGAVLEVPIVGGTPTTLVSNQSGPAAVAVDSTEVYFTNNIGGGIGQVLSVPLDGGTPTTLTTSSASTGSLALDSTNLYWAAGGSVAQAPKSGGAASTLSSGIYQAMSVVLSKGSLYGAYLGGSIVTVPATGGAATRLVSGLSQPEGLAANASGLWWSEWGTGIQSVALDGGTVTTLASGVGAPVVAIDATDVYWWDSYSGQLERVLLGGGTVQTLASGLVSQSTAAGIAVDTSNVYVGLAGTTANSYTDGVVVQVPTVGGTPATLVSGLTGLRGVTVSAGTVYWADGRGILSVPVDGGTPMTVAVDTAGATDLITDGTSVYWKNGSSIQKAPLDGGAAVTLVPQTANEQWLNTLAVDSTSLYWATGSQSTLMKVTPK